MPIPRFRKEPHTNLMCQFTGMIDPSMYCCGQGELGGLNLNSFPKGLTRQTLNWIQANYPYKQYTFVTYIDVARILAGRLKAGGAIKVKLIPWTNPLHKSKLGTVIFHVAKPTFDEGDYE